VVSIPFCKARARERERAANLPLIFVRLDIVDVDSYAPRTELGNQQTNSKLLKDSPIMHKAPKLNDLIK
jgi:hypothetical protein